VLAAALPHLRDLLFPESSIPFRMPNVAAGFAPAIVARFRLQREAGLLAVALWARWAQRLVGLIVRFRIAQWLLMVELVLYTRSSSSFAAGRGSVVASVVGLARRTGAVPFPIAKRGRAHGGMRDDGCSPGDRLLARTQPELHGPDQMIAPKQTKRASPPSAFGTPVFAAPLPHLPQRRLAAWIDFFGSHRGTELVWSHELAVAGGDGWSLQRSASGIGGLTGTN
jgi:hypothetical protein